MKSIVRQHTPRAVEWWWWFHRWSKVVVVWWFNTTSQQKQQEDCVFSSSSSQQRNASQSEVFLCRTKSFCSYYVQQYGEAGIRMMMATGDFLRAVYYWKSILRFCERVFHRSKQVCQVPTKKSPSRIERSNSRHPSADRKSRRSRSPPSISASFNRPNSSEWDDDGDRSKWPHQVAASKSANRIGRIESDVCCGRAWIEGHSKIAKADRDLSEWPPVWVGKPKQLCCSFQFWTVRLSAKEKSLSASRTDWPRST